MPPLSKCVFLASLLTLSGCGRAFLQTANYRAEIPLHPEFATATAPGMAIAVQDVRPDLLNGNISGSNVGTLRSMAGVPWAVKTQSGNPLAVDLAATIADSLKAKGFKAVYIPTQPTTTETQLREELAKQQTFMKDYLLLHFTLKQWHIEHWWNSYLDYCVGLFVRSAVGDILSTTSECNREELSGSNNDFRDLRNAAATIFDRLINTPGNKALFSGVETNRPPQTEVAATPSMRCTTAQVLQMKNSGLKDDQIKAACH